MIIIAQRQSVGQLEGAERAVVAAHLEGNRRVVGIVGHEGRVAVRGSGRVDALRAAAVSRRAQSAVVALQLRLLKQRIGRGPALGMLVIEVDADRVHFRAEAEGDRPQRHGQHDLRRAAPEALPLLRLLVVGREQQVDAGRELEAGFDLQQVDAGAGAQLRHQLRRGLDAAEDRMGGDLFDDVQVGDGAVLQRHDADIAVPGEFQAALRHKLAALPLAAVRFQETVFRVRHGRPALLIQNLEIELSAELQAEVLVFCGKSEFGALLEAPGMILVDEGDLAQLFLAHIGRAQRDGQAEVDRDVDIDQRAGREAIGVFEREGADGAAGGADGAAGDLPEDITVLDRVVFPAHDQDAGHRERDLLALQASGLRAVGIVVVLHRFCQLVRVFGAAQERLQLGVLRELRHVAVDHHVVLDGVPRPFVEVLDLPA